MTELANIKLPTTQDIEAHKLTGLPNFGNTCYLNSVVQVLIHIPELRQVLTSETGRKLISQNLKFERADVAVRMFEFFCSYWRGDQQTVYSDLRFLHSALGQHFSEFAAMRQNDQHECLMFLLEVLHQSMCQANVATIYTSNSETMENQLETQALHQLCKEGFTSYLASPDIVYTSPITKIFLGQTHKRTECVNCGHISHRFEAFRNLQLQIPKGQSGQKLSLIDCLENMTGITQLGENDQYRCDQCNKLNRSRQRTMIWRMPPVLTIVLVRNLTKFHQGRFISIKDPRPVDIPELLDISRYLSNRLNQPLYDLMAVNCHYGNTIGGHCIASLDNGNEWCDYDDTSVGKSSLNRDTSAYILYYRQR